MADQNSTDNGSSRARRSRSRSWPSSAACSTPPPPLRCWPNVCEPELQEEIKRRLDRMKLENALLQRQVELLDQSQGYRCCPVDGDTDGDG